MQTVAIIPARYASARLPGKPLVEIHGKAMIQHVYERVCMASTIERVAVATDDERIYNHVIGFGGEAVMTSSRHPSGTDRIAEAAEKLGATGIIVNVQGDEPMIDPAMLDALLQRFIPTAHPCATPIASIDRLGDLFDTNVVKVVARADGTALYFSRNPIPCIRDAEPEHWLDTHVFYRHIGVYAYRYQALRAFVSSPPARLEQAEQLEQLRMLDMGMNILCVPTEYKGHAVDTPEDVMHVELAMDAKKEN